MGKASNQLATVEGNPLDWLAVTVVPFDNPKVGAWPSRQRAIINQEASTMNGIQIQQILEVIENMSERNRSLVRQEVTDYLKKNMPEVVNDLETKGKAIIPTRHGPITLTTEDLNLVAA
jgi:hypothetical protein